MITMTALIAQGITDSSLLHHLQNAKANGISRTEAAEIITHMAFYAGWPKAWAAFRLAKDVWADDIKGDDAKAEFPRSMIFPYRRAQYGLRQVFHRQQLPGAGVDRADILCQRDF